MGRKAAVLEPPVFEKFFVFVVRFSFPGVPERSVNVLARNNIEVSDVVKELVPGSKAFKSLHIGEPKEFKLEPQIL